MMRSLTNANGAMNSMESERRVMKRDRRQANMKKKVGDHSLKFNMGIGV